MENNSSTSEVKFSWLRILKVVFVIFAVLAIAAGIYFFATARKTKILWANIAYGNREHYISCSDLPFYSEVQKSLRQHGDLTNKIKNLGAESVSAVEINCPSSVGSFAFLKGDILISYRNRAQRNAIEQAVGETFFGMPYREEHKK